MLLIKLRKSAIKDLKKINKADKERIHTKIQDLGDYPDVSNIKKLTDFEPAYRARVGNYRILFDVDETNTVIVIGRILHRSVSYR
jgi:mRNA interferase RelE/StbE